MAQLDVAITDVGAQASSALTAAEVAQAIASNASITANAAEAYAETMGNEMVVLQGLSGSNSDAIQQNIINIASNVLAILAAQGHVDEVEAALNAAIAAEVARATAAEQANAAAIAGNATDIGNNASAIAGNATRLPPHSIGALKQAKIPWQTPMTS